VSVVVAVSKENKQKKCDNEFQPAVSGWSGALAPRLGGIRDEGIRTKLDQTKKEFMLNDTRRLKEKNGQ
jgi:hypothetical protein